MKHEIGEYVCETCNKVFAYKKNYDEHCLTHDVEQIATTSEGKNTSTYTTRTHLKPHACSQCGNSYKRKDHLKRHELQHTGERPHVCLICTKAFFRKDKLIRHEGIHFKDKQHQYKCLDCKKEFLRKDSLDKHRRNVHGQCLEREKLESAPTVKETSQDSDTITKRSGEVESKDSYVAETNFASTSNDFNISRQPAYNNVSTVSQYCSSFQNY